MWWFLWGFCYLLSGAVICGLLEKVHAKRSKFSYHDLSTTHIALISGAIVAWPLLLATILAVVIAYVNEAVAEDRDTKAKEAARDG